MRRTRLKNPTYLNGKSGMRIITMGDRTTEGFKLISEDLRYTETSRFVLIDSTKDILRK